MFRDQKLAALIVRTMADPLGTARPFGRSKTGEQLEWSDAAVEKLLGFVGLAVRALASGESRRDACAPSARNDVERPR